MRRLSVAFLLLLAPLGCAKEAPVAAGPATAPAPAAAVPAAAAAAADPAAAAAAAAPAPAAAAAAEHADHNGHAEHEGSPGCDEPALAVQEPGATAPAAAAQPEGKVYGAGVTDATPVQVTALLADIDAWVGKKVRVEGLVTDVCPMRGCWFEMAGEAPGSSIRFKVRDGVMVFRSSAKGQTAVAEGVVRKIPLDLETSKRYLAHQAEEKGEAFDPASVTEPVTIVRLDGTGAVLRDKP